MSVVSGVVPVTVAVLTTSAVCELGMPITKVICPALTPTARSVVRVQVTTPASSVQGPQPSPDAERKIAPGGRVSVTTMSARLTLGPRLVTSMV